MKKILSLILVIATLLALSSCKDKTYPPVESTEEEKTVIMTFKYGKEKYEVRYELYRALFLNYSSLYDGGNKGFWDTAEADDATASINERISGMCADIFSVIHHAKSIGYDVYSSAADARVAELISQSVNGYADENNSFEGYNGDYDAYLAALKAMNLNYSVQDLLYRYSIATEKINEYYAGGKGENIFEEGKGSLDVSDDTVRDFYYSDEAVRVLLVTLDSRSYTLTRAEQIRDKIASLGSVGEVSNYIVGFTATVAEDAFDGAIIAKYSLDSAFYSELTESAFSLGIGHAGEVITISTGDSMTYYILYRVDKNDDHLEKKLDSVRDVYIANTIGKLVDKDKLALLETLTYTDAYSEIKHSEISMK